MVRQPVHGGMNIPLRRMSCSPVQRVRTVMTEGTTQHLNPQGELSVRKRLIVTGTTAAFVLTAGIMGAVAVQPPGPDQNRDTTAAPAVPDALQGLPPIMLKREATTGPGENGTVDVRSRSGQSPFTYTPPPASTYVPRHMAETPRDQPSGGFTMAPLPGIDLGNGSRPTQPRQPFGPAHDEAADTVADQPADAVAHADADTYADSHPGAHADADSHPGADRRRRPLRRRRSRPTRRRRSPRTRRRRSRPSRRQSRPRSRPTSRRRSPRRILLRTRRPSLHLSLPRNRPNSPVFRKTAGSHIAEKRGPFPRASLLRPFPRRRERDTYPIR